jgi:uncharacterized membrane protein
MFAEPTVTQSLPPPHTVSLTISANDSLSTTGTWLFFGSIFAGTIVISGGWAALGYWPVLPFAGLELAVLGLALYVCRARAAYRELLTISPEAVTLERGRDERREQLEWPRAWVRARLEPVSARRGRSRLLLCAAGRETEIAQMLTEAERRSLHSRLRELLAPGGA